MSAVQIEIPSSSNVDPAGTATSGAAPGPELLQPNPSTLSPTSAHSTSQRSLRSIFDIPPLEISVQDVSYEVDRVVKGGRGPFAKKRVETKQILKDITGSFRPGRLTCVMGASGAGNL